VGSFIGSRFVDVREKRIFIFGCLEVAIGLLAVIGIPVMAWLIRLNEGMWRSGGLEAGWTLRAEIYFVDTFLIMFLPALLMGLTFPLVSKMFTPDIRRRGQSIGRIYAVNTIGAILGSFAGGFLLIPLLGIQRSIGLIASLNCMIGVALLLLDRESKARLTKAVVFSAAAIIILLAIALPGEIISTLFAEKKKGFDLVYFKEGVTTTTTVHQDQRTGELLLATNGISVAWTDFMLMTTQRIQGHFPLFLHPHPKRVLTVGFGSGETSWVISTHGVEKVDCVEISPEVVEAARFFTDINYSFYANPHFTPIIMDGKNYVLMTEATYDVIMNDSIHPALAGNGSLYAREYFVTCRDHLNPGGIMSSWIPLFGLSERDFKILLKTFQDVFPFTTLWYGTNCLNRHALLIGSTDPDLKIDITVIRERLSDPIILSNLREIGIVDLYDVLSSFVMGPEAIARYSGEVPLNTDDNPILEFSTPKTPDSPVVWRQKLHRFTQLRGRVDPYLVVGKALPDERFFSDLDGRVKATEHMIEGWIKDLEGDRKRALHHFQVALQFNPQALGAFRYIRRYYEPMLDPDPETIGELLDNAKIYYQIGDLQRSIESFTAALNRQPDLAMAYYGLGRNYEAMADTSTAIEMYRKSLKIDPGLDPVRDRLKALTDWED
jgi:spermidine synthase